jgi:GntR family transcriptional regulator, transcriptional repressor for pyruvate dehydrogenase complex
VNAVRHRFGPVERRTLAEEIRRQIQQQIFDGILPAGARLPSERQLCDEFGVARTSVREAIQGLISVGLLERRGNRVHVGEELPTVRPDGEGRETQVHELFEVRRVIELPMTELAACRASDEERQELVDLADRFNPDLPIEEFRALDRAFHWAVARASHNPLLAEVYGKVLAALFDSEEWESMLTSERNAKAVRRIIESSCREHHEITAAIASGEAVRALEAVANHLDTVETRIVSQIVSQIA